MLGVKFWSFYSKWSLGAHARLWVCTPNSGSRGRVGAIQMFWHSVWLNLDWTRVHRTPAAGQLYCSCQLPRSMRSGLKSVCCFVTIQCQLRRSSPSN